MKTKRFRLLKVLLLAVMMFALGLNVMSEAVLAATGTVGNKNYFSSNASVTTHNFYPAKTGQSIAIANANAYGTNVSCTGMQGLAATEEYVYAAKINSNNTHAFMVQYNVSTKAATTMKYYPSLDENATQAALDVVAHCNDMTTHTNDEGTYMITANAYTPDSSTISIPTMTSFLLDEENATLRFTGYYNLVYYEDEDTLKANPKYIPVGSLRWIGEQDGYDYYLVKDKKDFYWFKIEKSNLGSGDAKDKGTAAAEMVTAYHLFTIDKSNALFEDTGGTYTIVNLDTWTNQGFEYNEAENAIYVPFFNGSNDNVILVYSMKDKLDISKLEEKNVDSVVFPSTRSFHIGHTLNQYEIESCVFLKPQDTTSTSVTMYINTNASGSDAIRMFTFTRPSNEELSSIVDEKSVVYTVEYNYGVDGVEREGWLQKIVSNNSMLDPRTHIAGITTSLRKNIFYRKDGYLFVGYNLYRQSDEKWLYADGNWYTESEASAEVEKQLVINAAAVDNLTTENGDTITAYAQWRELTVNNVGIEFSSADITLPTYGWAEGSNTFTVSCNEACVVLVSQDKGATYTRLTGTKVKNTTNKYEFTATGVTADTIIAVSVLGDADGNGVITDADITELRKAYAGKTALNSLQKVVADTNGSGNITNADITKLRAALAGKTTLGWN